MIARVEQWDAHLAQASLDQLIALLQDAVASGASIGFMPPLAADEAAGYWRKVLDDVAGGGRLLFAARDGERMVGSAQLALEMRPNGLHRAEVQKVMVHTQFRQQGIGRQLMLAVEAAARLANRTLLVLDTRSGDPSERLYHGLGYMCAGVIPHYARSADGELHDTALYYRLV